ncbi:MAG: hypothetical protein JJU36_08015 [Phycisphaeraceae bacterium]|nr:hypothetical protein [Phycisphaeraceae bacterium]
MAYRPGGAGWTIRPEEAGRLEVINATNERARQAIHDLAVVMYLLNRVNDPNDPKLQAARESSNPLIARLAEAQAGLLTELRAREQERQPRRP